jgi:hypothetical protein
MIGPPFAILPNRGIVYEPLSGAVLQNPGTSRRVRYPLRAADWGKDAPLSDTDKGHSIWLKVIAGLIALAVAGGLVAALLPHHRDRDRAPSASGPTTASSPSARPPLPQAKWHVHAFAAAVTSDVTKKDRKAARKQGIKAARGIRKVYYALLLDPSAANSLIRAHFEPKAARAFLASRARLSGRLHRIRTTGRFLRIGVDAGTAKRAIAIVGVLFKADQNSKRLKIKHKSTLWLERVHQAWKILAWHADQERRR